MGQHPQKFSKLFNLIRQSLRGEEHDYTKGSIQSSIVLLAIPMILELSLESVFAVVDMYFVSKLPDSRAAVATVGLTESMVTLIYTVGIGLSTAATALVARRIGEKDIAKASHAGAQSILLAILVSVLMAILGYCYAPDLLQIMGAQQEVILAGTDFSRIMLGGTTSIILLFLINGIFRGAGDPMIAMKSLWLASLINIILCPLLIFGYGIFPELGLTGAAVATTIGRTAGVFYQTYHLFKGSGMLKIKREHFKIDWAIQKSILTLAWPATLQFFIQSGSWIFLAYLVSTTGSTDASAGYQIAIRNVVFFILPAWGLSNAAAHFGRTKSWGRKSRPCTKKCFTNHQIQYLFYGCSNVVVCIFFITNHFNFYITRRGAQVWSIGITNYGYRIYFLWDWYGDDASFKWRRRHKNPNLDKFCWILVVSNSGSHTYGPLLWMGTNRSIYCNTSC
jgi:putative MATE family efflux protein